MDRLTAMIAIAQLRLRLDIVERYPHLIEDHMATPLDRLKDKFLQARGVAQRVASNMEAEADSLIAEEDAFKAHTTEAFAPHKAILGEARGELQAIKDALNLMSNGGPPLTDAEPIDAGSNVAPVKDLPEPPPAPKYADSKGNV